MSEQNIPVTRGPRGSRKPRKTSKWTYVLVVLMFLFVCFSYYAYQIVYTPNVENKGEPVYVLIPNGATYEQAMDSIDSKKVIIDRLSLRFMAKLMDYPELVKPGRYELKDGMTNYKLIAKLRSGDQDPVKLTYTNVRLKKDLAQKLSTFINASPAKIDSLLNSPAYTQKLGFDTTTILTMFIPNTYEMYWTTSAEDMMERMKKEYDNFWTEERKAKAQDVGLSQKEVSILASIVQAEQSVHADERPRIAGVYLNRLKRNMALQADPTVVFATGDFTIRRVLNVHLKTNSPYNTYLNKGLPPGPINLPSITSINAVLNPEEHEYLYFCAKEDFSGYHAFAVTEAEHRRNAQRFHAAMNQRNIMR
ncbi:endolytic transglycosylase MltG [Rufibacter sediminis]|uniref:Endolytic murein transglycosylase n=1 Tax=Rufibacter sediminis TaxID=2762756 RepID=A0ABR6VW23_9BACT|nr:endolytic transglycosylase MltG [Rufibacter sediminis]MBC3541384.1 endolytic transglycosylase MltG [Rufibacter sediminis]